MRASTRNKDSWLIELDTEYPAKDREETWLARGAQPMLPETQETESEWTEGGGRIPPGE